MSFSNGIYSKLQESFANSFLTVCEKSEYFVVENSESKSEEKIKAIISSSGFCPFISQNKRFGCWTFTIVPYKIPDFFNRAINEQTEVTNKTDYFHCTELYRLLHPFRFEDREDIFKRVPWVHANKYRRFVANALDKAIADIIQNKSDAPIIEIGSGQGYNLPANIAHRVFRTQPSIVECQLLSKKITSPIFHINVDGVYNSLAQMGKKIPHFFALNIFDTMLPDLRKKSLYQISQLQNPGDRIQIILDTNPLLNTVVNQLKKLHPGYSILPFFSAEDFCSKLSLIIIPAELAPQPTTKHRMDIMEMECRAAMNQKRSKLQVQLSKWQKEHNLKVVVLEDFFVEQMKRELEELGYEAQSYYHAAYTIGSIPNGTSEITHDIVYRSVSDKINVREWAWNDKNLIDTLARKGLSLPNFDEKLLEELREKNHKIFGAEILVIEGTKSH